MKREEVMTAGWMRAGSEKSHERKNRRKDE